MVLPLMLVLGLSLGQSPDFLEVQPLGGGYQVLAGGGLVYRWSGRGELTLEAQLGSPATALAAFAGEDVLLIFEQFIRARPSGGTIAYRSEAIQEWRSFIDKHQRVRMQEAPSRPARKVAVAPLPSP